MIEDEKRTLRYQVDLDKIELEERKQEYRNWVHGQLLAFQAFVQGELDRTSENPNPYEPTDRWFYEEAARVLPAIIDGTAVGRDEHRLAMAAHAIQLSMRLEDADIAACEEIGVAVGSETQGDRLRAAMGVSEVPFQHPWVFHLDYDRYGMPYVALPPDDVDMTPESGDRGRASQDEKCGER